MVQAILAGRKTMTRRAVKFKSLDPASVGAVHQDGSGKGWIAWQPGKNITPEDTKAAYPDEAGFKCPYGQIGDVLWVRETFRTIKGNVTGSEYDFPDDTLYAADGACGPFRPSIFMPKAACRIFLEITDIRVERLNDVSEEDAVAEGVEWRIMGPEYGRLQGKRLYKDYAHPNELLTGPVFAKDSFEYLWESINGAESWKTNPWVWVVPFKQIDKPEGFL